MKFNEKYPDFASIEQHIHRARVERAVYLADAIVGVVTTTIGGLRRLAELIGRNVRAEADRRAIEADAFLKRSVPKY